MITFPTHRTRERVGEERDEGGKDKKRDERQMEEAGESGDMHMTVQLHMEYTYIVHVAVNVVYVFCCCR